MKLIQFFLIITCGFIGNAQGADISGSNSGQEYIFPNTELHNFHSDILDEDLQIVIGLPYGYSNMKSKLPTMLVLDADAMFGLTSQIPQLMSFEGTAPALLTIGVIYGSFGDWIKNRKRDFHPSLNTDEKDGADRFLKAIKTEILPFVFKHYLADENNLSLYGHSSAGFFSMYTALKEPSLFNNIIASSPSLEWNDYWFSSYFDTFAKNDIKGPEKLFISIGGKEEKTMEAIDPIVREMRKLPLSGQINYKKYPDQHHMAVIPGAYSDALQWIYKTPKN